MSNFLWNCPYCGRNATITDSNFSSDVHFFSKDNKIGSLGLYTLVTTCPNPECKEFAIEAVLHETKYVHDVGQRPDSVPLLEWSLKPQSFAKPFPDYVPAPIRTDYEEACLIRDLSPKASATLSRRCLQGIIRDYWGIQKNTLYNEINELKNRIDSATWQAIDAVRSIGNIGAHMEKDINIIVDVDSTEAQLLIGLIEILIKDWYIARHDREVHLKSIIDIANTKTKEKSV